MQSRTPNSLNSLNARRHELAPGDGPLLVADADARQNPAFRFHVRRSLRMHPVLAAGVAAAAFSLLVVWALSHKPIYMAESVIYVEPLEVRVLTDGSSSGYDPSRYDSYLQQQIQTVERADTLEAALAKMPAGVWTGPGEPTSSAVRRLAAALKVERVLNSYQLSIDVSANTGEAAAAAANAVAQAYLEAGRKDEHARADQRLQLLDEERERITEDMSRDKNEQASLSQSLGVANPNGAAGNPYDMQSEGLRSQLAAAREAHDAVSAQLASVSGYNGTGLDTAANEIITTDPGLVSIRQTLSQRRAVLSDQMAGLTQANPVYKQDQEEIAALDRATDRATADARQRAERQLQDKLRLDLRRTADVEGRLNAQLAEQTAKATGAGPKLQRAAELETDLQRLSTRYATVDDAIRGLQLETGGPGQAHLALAARVPDSPQPSRTKLILLLALPLALACGIAAAVFARRRDPRLYLAGDMQEVLGFAPMCVLPSSREVSAAAFDEFLLRLAGGVESAYRHGGARSFVFTPVSVSGSAKELLPRICAKLRQIGFRALCVGAEELMPFTDRGIDSGPHPADGKLEAMREGVAATRLGRLLEEYDIVLVQAPPLLGSALTEYAVRCADATVLLVESARTNRNDLRRAAILLERLNPQGIGAVLEDMPLRYADSTFREAVRSADRSPLAYRDRAGKMSREKSVSQREPVAVHAEGVEEADQPQPAPVAEEPAHVSAVPEAPFIAAEAQEDSGPVVQPAVWDRTEARLPEIAPEPVIVQELPTAAHIEMVPLVFSEHVEPETSSPSLPTVEPLSSSPAFAQPEQVPEAAEPTPRMFREEAFAKHEPRGWAAWTQTETTLPPDLIVAPMEPVAATPEPVAAREETPTKIEEPQAPWADAVLAHESREIETPEAEKPVAHEHVTPRAEAFPVQSRKQPVSAPLFAAEQQTTGKKLTGWLRRMLRLTDEPAMKIIPDDEEQEEVMEAAPPVRTPAFPDPVPAVPVAVLEEGTVTPATPTHAGLVTQAPEEASGEKMIFRDPATLRAPSVTPEPEPDAFRQPAATSAVLPVIEPLMQISSAGVAPVVEIRAAERTFEPAQVFPQVLARIARLKLPPMDTLVEPLLEVPAVASAVSSSEIRPEAPVIASTTLPAQSAEQPSTAAPPETPRLSSARHRAAPPITVAAIPSLVTSLGHGRRFHREAVRAEQTLARRANAESKGEHPVAQGSGRSVAAAHLSSRTGIAAAAQPAAPAISQDGPPARASEGLAAMRKGAGLRKAVVRQEAALRSQALPPDPPRGEASMSRRWAMLSRFQRNDSANATDSAEGVVASASTQVDPANPPRTPHV